ncbi:hypothetical protein [Flavivirga eckloniae]|uniref:Lipocalin-like domain-containing protein n=1 Tax=Flavivirga eckloniae TaxID=1803846 RepID=A0A2K9PNV1_9FLAO|nr:hypothetical protein [Flavivirga eckloniae]AUP78739.1 hypothetical protein C1H87_08520 [Flavivirga eckloniae]
MLKKPLFIAAVLCCFLSFQCNEDDDNTPVKEICDQKTIVNKEIYNNLVLDASFTFVSAEITDNCLTIEIKGGGCDGNSWEYKLVDSGDVTESSPEQRDLKFQLINEEVCLAIVTRTVSFDLTPLQVSGSNEVILNLEGLKTPLRYKY